MAGVGAGVGKVRNGVYIYIYIYGVGLGVDLFLDIFLCASPRRRICGLGLKYRWRRPGVDPNVQLSARLRVSRVRFLLGSFVFCINLKENVKENGVRRMVLA